tara:strand:+ start:239 stop:448 length:210 start_codon:yes stop_codon:yes gene_type:complete
MVKFSKEDFEIWSDFRSNPKTTLSTIEYELICKLHSEYYKHRFYKPCTCSPKTIKGWIKDLNILWDNGN